ncbi:MAG: zinc-ribbon domain-containing protein [Clostridiales bacterium]|nr:zinc-ribbon domain-containing protein [Clostridiales bacterium]
MNKCEKCGIQVPDGAKFCPKCGAPIAQKIETPAVEPTQQESTNTVKKSTGGFLNKYFWVLFVSVGLLAYLLMEVAGMYLGVSSGFAITLGVFALIFGVCFCALGLMNKITSAGSNALRDNICLAVGIIVALTVLLGTIAVFNFA